MRSKLILNKCEIDDCEVTKCLQLHHIIPRTQENTSNDPSNLLILCPTHHAYFHAGKLKVISIYPSTKVPNGRTIIYELDGKRNIETDLPIQNPPQNKSFKLYSKE